MSHKKLSKRKQAINKITEKIKSQKFSLREAIEIIKKFPKTNFEQTVEVSLKLDVDPSKPQQQAMRGSISLPAGTGKNLKLAVIAQGKVAEEAKNAGAYKVGAEELIKEIESGGIDFDKLIATIDLMPKLAKLGRQLGPKGLMPNPRTKTIIAKSDFDKIADKVKELSGGKEVSFRVEKVGSTVHVPVGKVNFSEDDLIRNIKTVLKNFTKISSLYLTCTMGGGIKVDHKEAIA